MQEEEEEEEEEGEKSSRLDAKKRNKVRDYLSSMS